MHALKSLIFSKLLVLAGVVAFTLASAGTASAFQTIVIDAGHGGHDLGANNSLVYEKHLNLDVARRLERSLKAMGFRVIMTRKNDRFISLDGRSTLANRYRNAIFVSIHFNSSYKNKVTGIETFYKSSTGRALATYVQREIVKTMKPQDRGVKTANFSVLRKTRHPAILVEGGFISNKGERSTMMDPRYRQALVDSIVRGLMQFRNRR